MKKNDVLFMTCDTVGADMEGVCRHEGMAVFVKGMLPGESAPVRITKVQPRYAFGRLEKQPCPSSVQRQQPDCPAYPRCGGCTCRHMTYDATLEAKRRQVEDCFARIGHITVDVPQVIGMEHPFRYRNKTALPVGGMADEPVLGFFAPRSHDIIPVSVCPNAMEPSDAIGRALLDWMRRYAVKPYDEATHTGLIRHLVIRINRRHEAMATVVVNGSKLPHEKELADALFACGAVSVILNENRDRTNVIFGRRFRTVRGLDTLPDTLCGLRFELSPASFFQVNPMQTERLYQTALEFAQLSPNDRLCDLYCGAGTITLMMASHCKEALGIEIVPQAVDNARENALRNGITNASFLCGAAESILPQLVSDGLRPDVMVVDPPRKGLEPSVIDAMAKSQPKRIVYVSCNVATLARDTALLGQAGYCVERVQPVDMFCWTSGVETVVLLSHKKPDSVIKVKVEFGEGEGKVPLDNISNRAEAYKPKVRVTYKLIKEYIEAKYGFKVHTAYIAEVKRDLELPMYDAPNAVEELKQPRKHPTAEKVEAIKDALKYFGVI